MGVPTAAAVVGGALLGNLFGQETTPSLPSPPAAPTVEPEPVAPSPTVSEAELAQTEQDALQQQEQAEARDRRRRANTAEIQRRRLLSLQEESASTQLTKNILGE